YLGGRDSGGRYPVLKCPADGPESAGTPSWPTGVYLSNYEYEGTSYWMTWAINGYCYYPSAGRPRIGFPGDGLINPGGMSEAPFVTDAEVDAPGGPQNFGPGPAINTAAWVAAYWNPWMKHMFRHSGRRANMLYLDGHVQAILSAVDSGPPTYV